MCIVKGQTKMSPQTDKTEMWAVKRTNWNVPGEKVRLKCDPKRSVKKIDQRKKFG